MTHLNDTSLTTRRIVLCIIIVPAIVVGVLLTVLLRRWVG